MKKIILFIILMFSLMITSCKTGEKSIEYKVSFASNGGSIIGDVTIKEGIKFCEPTPPTKEGYTFGGWFKDYDLTIPYSFNEEITKNLTLYAKWIPNVIKCTIFFNTNDGMYVEPIVLNSGDKITNLPITYKKGYEFLGWYIDEELTTLFDNETEVECDLLLHAKYQKLEVVNSFVTVSFETNSDQKIDSKVILQNSKIDCISLENKKHYRFLGWYIDLECITEFDFNKPITSDITLYAKWELIRYQTLYKEVDGTLIYEQITASSMKHSKPIDPTKEGYTFVGWYIDSNLEVEYEFGHYLNSDTTLYAKWEEIILKSNDATLKEIYVNGKLIEILNDEFVYQITISNGKKFVVSAVTNDDKALVNGGGEYTIEVGNYHTVILEVIAEDNTKLIYTLFVITNETSNDAKFLYCEGLFESISITLIDSNYKEIKAYYKKSNETLYNQIDNQLIRNENGIVRIDILGLQAGNYDVKVVTSNGETITKEGILVQMHDRSGYAFFGIGDDKIGAYNDDGSLKSNADVIYVTNENKNTVTYNGKTGLVNILNSLKNITKPVCIRIIGSITTNQFNPKTDEPRLADGSNYTNEELVAFSTNTLSTEYGENLVGLTSKITIQGYKNIVHTSTKTSSTVTESVRNSSSTSIYSRDAYPNVKGRVVFDDDSSYNMVNVTTTSGLTIEGVGTNAEIFQWGFNFSKSKFVEIKNLTFTNAPEDACSFSGGSNTDNNYYGFWVHNNTFNKGYNSWDITGERDKYNGDGSVDLRYVHNVTLSYNKFNNTHKTGLVGGSDGNMQYNITFHHNYYYNVGSRLPLGRQANMHIYNNYYYNCSSTLDIRANAYVLSEGNYFESSRVPKVEVKTDSNIVSAVKSLNDIFINCSGNQAITVVTNRETIVNNTNNYGKTFDTNPDLFYYDAINKKSNVMLLTDAYQAKEDCIKYSGVLKME